MFCVTILGMYMSIRRRATTYRLLDSSSSLLPTSRRLRCCSKPTNFDDGPPHTAATKPDGERHGRILHTSTMARNADNEKHERLEQGFWLVTSLLAKPFTNTYHSPPLSLISPSPKLRNLNPAPSTSITSYELISAGRPGGCIPRAHR